MAKEAEFQWTCPACDYDQTERVTVDGPVMSLICENCVRDFGPSDLPREIRKAWTAAIEEVIPA